MCKISTYTTDMISGCSLWVSEPTEERGKKSKLTKKIDISRVSAQNNNFNVLIFLSLGVTDDTFQDSETKNNTNLL